MHIPKEDVSFRAFEDVPLLAILTLVFAGNAHAMQRALPASQSEHLYGVVRKCGKRCYKWYVYKLILIQKMWTQNHSGKADSN